MHLWPPVAKAVVSALVTACAYLVGVVPAEGGFDDVTVAQWLGLVVFVGSAYGLTWATPNRPVDRARDPGLSEQAQDAGYVHPAVVVAVVILVIVALFLIF